MYRSRVLRAGLVAAVLAADASHAATVSYDLTLSNATPYIPSGTPYARVTIDNEGATGLINFTVDILPNTILTNNAGTNFGLQSFGFNVVTPGVATFLTSGNFINLPTDWSATFSLNPPASGGTGQDGFGKFDAVVADGGTARVNPTLTFSIDLGGNQGTTDSVLDYIATNSSGYYFAAHITGFNDLNPNPPADNPFDGTGACYDTTGQGDYTAACNILTSVYVAAVPVPAAIWLFGSGLLGMIGIARRKRGLN